MNGPNSSRVPWCVPSAVMAVLNEVAMRAPVLKEKEGESENAS